ncbi:MAG: hypothetical protein AAGG81_07130 [Chlamydiota bacterium]
MKSPHTVSDWAKKQLGKNKRVRLLGNSFLLFAFILFALALFSQQEMILSTSEEQREGYYMMGLVIAVMGIFCLNSAKNID